MKATVVPIRDTLMAGGDATAPHMPDIAWRSFVHAPALPETADGIEVSEQELCRVTAQRLYLVRCECGRRWFELEMPALVECPACHRLGSLAG